MSNSKKFLNSIKCPICLSQIDKDNGSSIYNCVLNINHYRAGIYNDFIETETVSLFDFSSLSKYEIWKKIKYGIISFTIYIRDIDAEGRTIFKFEDKTFRTDVNLFDFRNFNKDTAINKIKTVMLFQ
jgi:hypothetical protein